ncbi:D-arabinose 1-dehydrogenase [Aureococcus anophagefferens]|nr:D-arabinose 1-dehydrogenase [Aureococcus anophagefferens]
MDTKKQLALAAGASLGLVALYRWQRRSKKAAPPPLERRLAPGLEVTVLGCGGASLGDLYVETTHESALATLRTSLDGGIQFYDTAPWYGCGLSEARFGLGLGADRVAALNTKVGRTLEPDLGGGPRRGWKHGAHFSVTFDYSGAAFKTQLRDSPAHGPRVESLVIHDLSRAHKSADDPTGAATTKRHLDALASSGFAALCELRASGAIRPSARALLNFSAAGILGECEKRRGVVIGGPFSSGILATGPDPPRGTAMYNYRPASDDFRWATRPSRR